MKPLNFFIAAVCLLTLGSTAISCAGKGSAANAAGSKKLLVYSSFYAMYDFSVKIGGDRVIVSNLTPTGVDPHDWEPTPKDMVNLEKSDILVCNGASMEGWLAAITNSINNKKQIVVIASSGISYLPNKDPEETMQYNPHTWLYPQYAIKELENIRDAFIKADPADKAYFELNYEAYSNKFEALDKEFKDAAKNFKKRDLVVSHQAYDYLCQAYGLNQLPVEGVAAESEPSAKKMAEIEDFIRAHHVKVIFGEELLSPKIEETLAHDTGITNIEINPLEGLSPAELSNGMEYISVMHDNLEKIRSALD